MGIGFRVGRTASEVGTQDFLHAFFSTISYCLESNGWGSRFPELMNELYQGALEASKADKVLKDVEIIKKELKTHPPDDVVWDIEDLMAKPPWGSNISSAVTDLSNYFVTSNGKNLFDVLTQSLETSRSSGLPLTIDSY